MDTKTSSVETQCSGVLDRLVKEGRVRGREVRFEYRMLVLDLSRPELIALIREVTPAKLFKEVFKEGMRFRRLRPEAEKAKP